MNRRCLGAVLAVLLAVAGCANAGAPKKNAAGQTKLTLLLDWTPNTNHSGIYIAKEKGWYKQAGIDLRIIEPGQDSNATQMLATNKADFAISTEEEITPAVAQGLPVLSIAAILQHNTSSLVALRSAGVTRPRDLAGKKYGGFGGQLEKQLVDAMVKCDGGDPSTVKYVQIGDADYRVGLTKKFYDFVWIFDGWEGLQFTKIDHLKTVSFPFRKYPKCVPDWYTPVIATSQRVAEADPAVVKKFLQVTRKGYQRAMRDPDAATGALMAAAPDLDRKLVDLSAHYLAKRYAEDPQRWGRQDKAVWTRMTDFLRRAKLVDKDIDVDDAFTNRFLQ